ncbi:MAG: YihY/virulence factor BrkB family protein [Pseudobdellovibrio sp.]
MVEELSLTQRFFRKLSEEFEEIHFAATSLSFSTLFSLVPFLIVIFSFFRLVGGFDDLYPQVEKLILGSLKEATGSAVTRYLKASLSSTQIKTMGYTGLIFLLFSTFGLFRNIDRAFQRVWKIKPKRSFLKRLWIHSLIIMLVPLAIAAVISVFSLNLVHGLHSTLPSKVWFFLSATLSLSILYYIVPDTKVNKKSALISSIIASLALSAVQSSFLWFSIKVIKQNKIYGSLASIPIFMIWLLVVWTIILSGTSLCAFLQQKIFKNT